MTNYITADDIYNGLFNRRDIAVRQVYIDRGNSAVDDIATVYEVAEADIASPYHLQLKTHAMNIALSYFGADNINKNNTSGFTDVVDVYKDIFMLYDMLGQRSSTIITKVMFTGEAEDGLNRAVDSINLYRQ